jgi:RNA polymerase sigma factor (sigma-70 family)
MVDRQVDHAPDPPRAAGIPSSFNDLSDRQLLDQFVQGHKEPAFAALVNRHGSMVRGVCRSLLHHVQDAEDAFQATFLVLVLKAPSLNRPDTLASWLSGVAYRTALQARARANRRRRWEREAAMAYARHPPHQQLSQDLREEIDRALAHLPEKFRAPLVLCYLEGRTNEQAARLLGWPTGTISYRLARGRQLLRESLLTRQSDLFAAPAPLL